MGSIRPPCQAIEGPRGLTGGRYDPLSDALQTGSEPSDLELDEAEEALQ